GVAPAAVGARIGTPAFMSPEQAAGRLGELGPASDVYSLGATLSCLLTGKPPFTADSGQAEMLAKIERGDHPAPQSMNPRVDRGLEAVCRKAMAVKPGDRYLSFRRFRGRERGEDFCI